MKYWKIYKYLKKEQNFKNNKINKLNFKRLRKRVLNGRKINNIKEYFKRKINKTIRNKLNIIKTLQDFRIYFKESNTNENNISFKYFIEVLQKDCSCFDFFIEINFKNNEFKYNCYDFPYCELNIPKDIYFINTRNNIIKVFKDAITL